MQIDKKLVDFYKKQHYAVIGSKQHSAVKTCHWTKASLRGKGVCYKEKFYGIHSNQCIQMTPSLFWCDQKCDFCWRNMNASLKLPISKFEINLPKEIVAESISAQKKLLSGFPGAPNLDKKKFAEALAPNQVAISLAGEPTLYPLLSELIAEYKKNGFSTFVVSNGLHPEVLKKLKPLPTQLYLSLDAPNEKIHKKLNKPQIKDSWKRLNKSLALLPKLKTRTCIRITLVKGINDKFPEDYAKLLKKSKCDFAEVKAYMHIGESRKRLTAEHMPLHKEVKLFAEKINKHLKYKLIDESIPSRVVLLWNGKTKLKIKK